MTTDTKLLAAQAANGGRMSKALELAKECLIGMFHVDGETPVDVCGTVLWTELETFYRRAQAHALRNAADTYGPVDSIQRNHLRRMADELEAGK